MESPDGKTLFFTKTSTNNRTTSLWRMPSAGGDETQVVPELFRYNYALTADGVYYSTVSTPAAIEFLDFASGKKTTIHTLAKPVDLGLAVSPDGRYLLFAQNDLSGSDLVLVENFR